MLQNDWTKWRFCVCEFTAKCLQGVGLNQGLKVSRVRAERLSTRLNVGSFQGSGDHPGSCWNGIYEMPEPKRYPKLALNALKVQPGVRTSHITIKSSQRSPQR